MSVHVLSKNSSRSIRENVIATTSNFAPNQFIPCGNICPHIPLILIL